MSWLKTAIAADSQDDEKLKFHTNFEQKTIGLYITVGILVQYKTANQVEKPDLPRKKCERDLHQDQNNCWHQMYAPQSITSLKAVSFFRIVSEVEA